LFVVFFLFSFSFLKKNNFFVIIMDGYKFSTNPVCKNSSNQISKKNVFLNMREAHVCFISACEKHMLLKKKLCFTHV
jgi:hypothetical protein